MSEMPGMDYRIAEVHVKRNNTGPRMRIDWRVKLIRAFVGASGMIFPRRIGKMAVRWFGTPSRRKIRSWEKGSWDFAEELFVDHAGIRLHGYARGQGPKVLLIHGWESRAHAWGAFASALVDAGFRVVAFDGPAHGDSGGKTTNILRYGEAIGSIQEEHGPFEAVVGHSLGSAVSMFQYPTIQPKKMALVASPSAAPDWVDLFASTIGLRGRSRKVFEQGVNEVLEGPVDRFRVEHIAPKIDAPVLLVHDLEDRSIPHAEGRRVSELIENSTLVTTSGLGHTRILWDPTVVNEVMGFLEPLLHHD